MLTEDELLTLLSFDTRKVESSDSKYTLEVFYRDNDVYYIKEILKSTNTMTGERFFFNGILALYRSYDSKTQTIIANYPNCNLLKPKFIVNGWSEHFMFGQLKYRNLYTFNGEKNTQISAAGEESWYSDVSITNPPYFCKMYKC